MRFEAKMKIDLLKDTIQGILQRVRSIMKKGSFMQNVSLSIFGNGSSFIISFLLTPIITRIYEPEAYGVFTLINSITTNLSMIVHLNYAHAFILPKSESRFLTLVQLTLIVIILNCILLTLIYWLFGNQILAFFDDQTLKIGFLLIIPFVFLSCLGRAWSSWNVRKKKFRQDAVAKFVSALFAKGFTLTYGIHFGGYYLGLLIGEMIYKMATILSLSTKEIRSTFFKLFRKINVKDLKDVAIEYKAYPMYTLPANWLDSITSLMPIYTYTYFFGGQDVGYFAMANSLLNYPMQMLGNAFATVFLQKAAEVKNTDQGLKKLRNITVELYGKIVLVGVIPFAIIFAFGDIIFVFVLGNNWASAGNYASAMSIFYVFALCAIPISVLYRILNKERIFMFAKIINLIVTMGVLALGYWVDDPIKLIWYFSIATGLLNIFSAVLSLNFVQYKGIFLLILKNVLLIIVVYGGLYGVRLLFLNLIN